MRNLIKILLMVLTIVSCKNQTKSSSELNNETFELKKESIEKESVEKESIEKELQKTISVAEQWNFMVFEKGGCLGGAQFVQEPKREPPTMVFSEKEWKRFIENDKTELTHFLISKLSDTTETKIHTCPFFGATNGEMAIYSLQHIHNKNWFDFSEFKEYKDKEYKSAVDQPQMWLQSILKNEKKRERLAELYIYELKK